jgi:inorganic pyrophosphatase
MERLNSFLTETYAQYTVLENKKVVIEKFQDQAEAYRVIREALERYQKEKRNLVGR